MSGTAANQSATRPGSLPFSSELADGERLVWMGKPVRTPRLWVSSRLVPPFAIAWAVVSAARLITLSRSWGRHEVGLSVVVIAGVLLFAGLTILLIPFVQQWSRARRYLYAITDRRVLVADRLSHGTGHVVSRSLGELGLTTHWVRRDGAGSIEFGAADLSFDDVPNADDVFDRLRGQVDGLG